MTQSKQEREALNAKWQNSPEVTALRKALLEFIAVEGLNFDVDGMNKTAAFVQQWTKDNGPLPDSGIHTG